MMEFTIFILGIFILGMAAGIFLTGLFSSYFEAKKEKLLTPQQFQEKIVKQREKNWLAKDEMGEIITKDPKELFDKAEKITDILQ